MEIWLDSVDQDTIQLGNKLGIIKGVTSNPSLITLSKRSLNEALLSALQSQRGPVAAQVTGETSEEMIEQAEILRDFSERILIKIPITQEGLKAMSALVNLQIPVMATAAFTPIQTLLACQTGVQYIALYFSKIDPKKGQDTLEHMLHSVRKSPKETKILAASLQSEDQVIQCLTHGVHGITLKKELFLEIIQDSPQTLEALKHFKQDWKKAKPSHLF